MGEISISFRGSIVLLAFLVLAGIVAGYFFYRSTLPPLPPLRRRLLSALRAASVTMLLLLMFEPIFHITHHENQRPAIALLIDDSQSMTMSDRLGGRSDAVRRWLAGDALRSLRTLATLDLYSFSSSLHHMGELPTDSLRFDGETTDMSQSLAQLKDEITKGNVQAAVLLSDGNYTVGRNPSYEADALGIPIYSIGVGDTSEQKDVLIERIASNGLVYAESRTPVDVTVKSSGYGGERVEVTLAQAGTVLDRKVLTLGQGTQEYRTNLAYIPHEEGTMKYTVSVSELPGELTTRNNSRTFFAKVLKSKLCILLIAGAANPDVPAVRQILEEDDRMTVRSFVQRSSGDFYEGRIGRSELDSADCIVMVGFPSSSTTATVMQEILVALDQSRKPIFFINGKLTDYTKLKIFEHLLPFRWDLIAAGELLVSPSVDERAKNHALVMLNGEAGPDAWRRLPPVYKAQAVFRAKPESEALVEAFTDPGGVREPLLVTRDINRQKCVAITGYGIWRWRLMTQGTHETENLLPLLVTNAVRWLTTKEDERNVRIVPTKEMFTTAEPVELSAQVYDEQLHPVDNAEVVVDVRHDQERYQVPLNAVGSGRYEGSVEGIHEGEYAFSGTAKFEGRVLGEDKGRFTVGQMNVEFLETKMNKQLLEQMAFRTGGRYYDVAHADNLPADMKNALAFTPKELVQKNELELWNWQYTAAAIIVLLAVEWFVRKRNGML